MEKGTTPLEFGPDMDPGYAGVYEDGLAGKQRSLYLKTIGTVAKKYREENEKTPKTPEPQAPLPS